jgi:hypothetical protein
VQINALMFTGYVMRRDEMRVEDSNFFFKKKIRENKIFFWERQTNPTTKAAAAAPFPTRC